MKILRPLLLAALLAASTAAHAVPATEQSLGLFQRQSKDYCTKSMTEISEQIGGQVAAVCACHERDIGIAIRAASWANGDVGSKANQAQLEEMNSKVIGTCVSPHMKRAFAKMGTDTCKKSGDRNPVLAKLDAAARDKVCECTGPMAADTVFGTGPANAAFLDNKDVKPALRDALAACAARQ